MQTGQLARRPALIASCNSRRVVTLVTQGPRSGVCFRKSFCKCRRGQQSPAVRAAEESSSSLDSHDEESLAERLKQGLQLSTAEPQPWVMDSAEHVQFRGRTVALYIGGAFAFGFGVWATLGRLKAEEYFAGYLLEQSLSVDNLFVFILVFSYFKTPIASQGKVLTWGLLTAAFLRLGMILIGVELIENFQPVLLGFAGILLFSSWGLLTKRADDDDGDLADNNVVKLCRRLLSVTDDYDGENFFTMIDGVREATPLLLVLAVIELSDVVFAVDSIPAVFGVTTDPFIIWTSNMWALLSLRSLYSFVAVAMAKLRFLDKAVALVLAWVGFKLCAEFFGQDISTTLSLAVVASTLASGVAASFLFPAEQRQ